MCQLFRVMQAIPKLNKKTRMSSHHGYPLLYMYLGPLKSHVNNCKPMIVLLVLHPDLPSLQISRDWGPQHVPILALLRLSLPAEQKHLGHSDDLQTGWPRSHKAPQNNMAHKLSVNAVETQQKNTFNKMLVTASVEVPKFCTIRPFLVLRVALQSKQSIVMNVTASSAPFGSTLLRKPSKTPASSSSRSSFSVPMSIASLDARWCLRLQLHHASPRTSGHAFPRHCKDLRLAFIYIHIIHQGWWMGIFGGMMGLSSRFSKAIFKMERCPTVISLTMWTAPPALKTWPTWNHQTDFMVTYGNMTVHGCMVSRQVTIKNCIHDTMMINYMRICVLYEYLSKIFYDMRLENRQTIRVHETTNQLIIGHMPIMFPILSPWFLGKPPIFDG